MARKQRDEDPYTQEWWKKPEPKPRTEAQEYARISAGILGMLKELDANLIAPLPTPRRQSRRY